MKPTIKVSIGSVAFNLEEDAYKVLDNYLKSLKQHFANSNESTEIIADIEYRLCELLQMRQNDTEAVILLDDATSVLKIMGNPKDFGDVENEETTNTPQSTGTEDTKQVNINKKKLYRDTNNGVIAGVCSGLGHYFRIDVVIIRILFLLPLFLGMFGFGKAIGSIMTIYSILWIVMPKARTFEDKLKMTGTNASIANIENRELSSDNKYRGSGLKEVLKFFFKTIILLIGISMALTLLMTVLAFVWMCVDTDLSYATNYLAIVGMDNMNIKIAIFAILTLPLIGFCNLLFKLFKGSPFKSQNLVLLLIGISLWFGSAIYIGYNASKYANNLLNNEREIEELLVDTKSSTLYVSLSPEHEGATMQPKVNNIVYRKLDSRNNEVSFFNRVQIERDSTINDFKISVSKHGMGDSKNKAIANARNLKFDHTISDSLLTINPQWYSNEHPWDMGFYRVKIIVPKDKEVVLQGYLENAYSFE